MKYIIILLTFAFSAFAIDYQSNSINVLGKAEIEVKPNLARFTIGVVYSHKVVDSAIVKVNASIAKMDKVFKKFSLDKNTAKLKNLSIREDYEYIDQKRVFQSYAVTRNYEVSFHDMAKLKDFLFEIYQAGANDIDDIQFTRTDYKKIDQDLILTAIEDAEIKAKIISKKVNVRLSGVDVISDESPDEFSYQNRVRFNFPQFGKRSIGDMLGGLLGGGLNKDRAALKSFFDIDPGKIKMSKEVWMTYKTK